LVRVISPDGRLNRMLYKPITYLKHQLTATNQHGTHSPFVYNYVTKCLYDRPKYKISKSIEVLLKSIGYFSAEHIKIVSKNSKIENRIQQEFGLKSNKHPLCDIIYFEYPPEEIRSLLNTKKVHNNTMVLYDNIHRNKKNTSLWENIKLLEEVTVTIDLFYCGAIFFRKEQAKEHFKIRI